MKPLTNCPYCDAPLVKKTIPEHLNPTTYQNCSKRCVVDYFQYYTDSYEDEELQYVSMNTPDNKFNFYYYTNHGAYPRNTIHAYSNLELKKHGRAMPFVELHNFDLHVNKEGLEKFQEKLSTYMIFS